MPKKPLQETAGITDAAAAAVKDTGRMPVQLISPGWGSSGYYSAEVLQEAAAAEIIPAGTHMYADHPTPTELKERPVRSIKDLMSVTVEAAHVATDEDIATWGAEPGALVAEVDVLPAFRDTVEHLKDAIGVSIRGDGEINPRGEAPDGTVGKIVEGLEHVKSVDWVTRAGRGGKVLSLVESAKANARAIAHGLDEATVNDTREALHNELRDAYGSDDVWIWVRDFDETTVWFEIETGDDAGVYGQTYSSDDGTVKLTGQRAEVRVETNYVPVDDTALEALLEANPKFQALLQQHQEAAEQLREIVRSSTSVPATRPDSTTTKESKEDTMPKIQIEEAEHQRLTETAGRVDALQEENTTLKAEVSELKEEKAHRARTDRANELIAEAAKEVDVEFTPLEVKGLLADLPLKEDALDEEAFTTAVKTDAAAKKVAEGAGRVVGMGGGTGDGGAISWDDIDEAAGLEKKGA